MAVEATRVINAGDLTDADRSILDELREGARTKKYIIDETGLHRNTVGNRLDVLEAGDVVRSLHDTTALYELVDDPRDDFGKEDNIDLDKLRKAVREAREAYEDVDGNGVDEAIARLERITGAAEE